ncbi:MAG: noc [Bacilli bacterium]|nr:noc [Bacilli bacterium]
MRDQLSRMFGMGERDSGNEEVRQLPTGSITSSPYQPRSQFDDERIEELSQTIRTHGIIQPIVVRRAGQGYELIAGERRLRAAIKIGLSTVPAIVRDLTDAQAASVALIENLQREGLTPVEEAIAYNQLLTLHGLTQESLAQRLGKGQSTIANKLRLLHLPGQVQDMLLTRSISERHARALLVLPSVDLQLKIASEIVARDLNVKQTEDRVKLLLVDTEPKSNPAVKAKRISLSRDVRLAVNTIRQSLEMIHKTGLAVKTEEQDTEDYYEFVIRVPKS